MTKKPAKSEAREPDDDGRLSDLRHSDELIIIDAEDILADARDYAECVFMAAAQLEEEQCDPIQTVVSKARRKIDEAIAFAGRISPRR